MAGLGCRAPSGHALGLVHPGAAHRLVDVDQGEKELALRLRVLQLGIEELGFGVGDFEVAGVPVFVAQARKARVIAQRG